jgi:hypothetical protein
MTETSASRVGREATFLQELPETPMGAEGTPPGQGEGREAHDPPA